LPESKKPRKNITPIKRRKFEKGTIKSPLHLLKSISAMQWSSWLDDFLPNMLWAALCVGNMERDEALQLLRDICHCGTEVLKEVNGAQLGHNYLATLPYEKFEEIFSPIKSNEEAREACAAIALVSSLPDHSHWQRFFPDASDLHPLVVGVASCLDHHSQEATGVRWAKVYFMINCGRVHAPPEFIERVVKYPNLGDMRQVRPSIRAFEMAIRNIESGTERPEGVPEPQPHQFWDEMMNKTSCAIPKRSPLEIKLVDVTRNSIQGTLSELCDHFMSNIKTTSVDPRLDGAFGLAINMLTLAMEVSVGPSNNFATGRIILRTIIENYITLKYLSHKDEETIWMQYRNYGSGQTALAFLKNVFAEETPDSIDMERLEMLANEDAWLETKDIAVGNWAKLDLRKMATDSGEKDLYDAYYDWTSGFVHGHWGAVRDSSFTVCMNPLHRLHRVPAPGNPMPTVLTDCCKICNRGLDEIGKLFPSFKPRIDWKSDASKA
jgi:Family of unknown function (DUF5677)